MHPSDFPDQSCCRPSPSFVSWFPSLQNEGLDPDATMSSIMEIVRACSAALSCLAGRPCYLVHPFARPTISSRTRVSSRQYRRQCILISYASPVRVTRIALARCRACAMLDRHHFGIGCKLSGNMWLSPHLWTNVQSFG